jgi:hypothetical protein
MKKFILLFVITISLISCTKEHNAKTLIKDYLKSRITDFDSYRSVKFSELDSSWTTYGNTEEAKLLEDSMSNVRFKLIDTLISDNEILRKQKADYFRQKAKYDKGDNEFVPEFSGWNLRHDFRVKNDIGQDEMKEIIFFFNWQITEITDTWEVK